MFNFVLVGFLNDNFVFPNADKHVIADLHPSDRQLVFVQVDVDVVIFAVFTFRTAGAELLFPYHRDIL